MSERLRLKPGRLEWVGLDEEVVALDTEDSRYLAVNRAGTVLWPALETGASVAELSATLAERFSLDPAVARRDVEAFVAWLRARGLVVTDDGTENGER